MKIGFWGHSIFILFGIFFCTVVRCMEKAPDALQPCYKFVYTLQQKCLLTLVKNNTSESLPENLKHLTHGFKALKKLHSPTKDSLTQNDIEEAFWVCAPCDLKDKILSINQRRSPNIPQQSDTSSTSADTRVPSSLNMYDGLTWILAKHCKDDIHSALIQISRYEECKKRNAYCAVLLCLGADVNHFGTVHGRIRKTTPLITATINKRLPIITMLLKHGANPNGQEADGYTAYTLVKGWQTPHPEILTLLQHYGAVDMPRNIPRSSNTPWCCLLH